MDTHCHGQHTKVLRQAIAYFLWLSPFIAYPLVWLRPFRGMVPFWGDVQFISSHVMGLLAVSVVLLYPERIKKLFSKPTTRYWFIASAAAAIVAVANHIMFPGNPAMLLAALQTLCLPLAGIALAPELKRAALPCGAAACLILTVFTAAGDRFLTGFTGNWNWNLTMICGTIPALTLLLCPKKHPFIIAAAVNAVIILSVFFSFPEITPRGTTAAMAAATLFAPIIRKISRERRTTALVGIALAVIFLFFATINAPISNQVNDSRFQLWKSSVNMVKEHIFTGCGAGRFEQAIRPHMTKEYFFTEFAATRHPHPHNELLFYISEYGIIGAAVLILFCGSALKQKTLRYDHVSRWLTWLFLLLVLHGQVDVLLSTPLAGCWFLLIGGTLAARGTGKTPVKAAKMRTVFACVSAVFALYFAVNIFSATYNLRQAKLHVLNKNPLAAKRLLDISLKRFPLPEARYIAANVLLFDMKEPRQAIMQLIKLENEICGGYLHSYGITARALTVLGKFAEAKEHFELERKAFPFSALYAGFELGMLQMANASKYDIAQANERLIKNLELRDLTLSDVRILHRDANIDDAPLKWSKLK